MQDHHLLVELKRPSISIDHIHEAQALKYRDDLQPQLQKISVLLVGKGRDKGVDTRNARGDVEVLSYVELISKARRRLEWLIRDLKN